MKSATEAGVRPRNSILGPVVSRALAVLPRAGLKALAACGGAILVAVLTVVPAARVAARLITTGCVGVQEMMSDESAPAEPSADHLNGCGRRK